MSEEEDVRYLVPAPQAPVVKPPRYRSQHPGTVHPRLVPCSQTGVRDIRTRATMGPGSGEPAANSSQWLRAHEKEPLLPQPHKPPPRDRRKVPVPVRDERPAMGLSSGRDFVQSNVQEAAQAAPKYQEHDEVRYVFKPSYGELPPYLRRRKQELQAQREAQERARLPQQEEEEGVQMISGEALAELIRHLKLKWQSVNEAYVRLPCVLDTPSKRRRKEELEAQLAEIERDVKMLSKASSVRVAT